MWQQIYGLKTIYLIHQLPSCQLLMLSTDNITLSIQHLNLKKRKLIGLQLTAQIDFSSCGASWGEYKLKIVQRIPAPLRSHSWRPTGSRCIQPSAPTRSTGIWKYDISPLVMSSDSHSGAGFFKTASLGADVYVQNKSNSTWQGRCFMVRQADWSRESWLLQHWCYVYLARPLSHPLTPAENTPWQTAVLLLPSSPHHSCSLSPDTPALETNSFSFTGENRKQ